MKSIIVLQNTDRKHLEISTKGFNNFMLCIEPITQYTSYTNQKFSEENMSISKGINRFSIHIKVI